MTQDEIQYVTTIAKHKNMTRAAAELYISQPALSQTLAKIEERYHQPLFSRDKKGLFLTLFGERYIETARKIQSRYHTLEHELDDFRTLKKGEIRFGLPHYLGTMILPTILSIFSIQYPNVSIQYFENTSEELNHMLLNGQIDFAILHHHEQSKNAQYELLLEDPFYLITPQIEKSERQNIRIADLNKFKNESFILMSKGYRSRDVADVILQKAQISPSIRFTTKNMETAKRLVASGLGVTFLPKSFLSLYSDMSGLCAYALPPELCASWKLVLSYQKGTHLSATASEFMKLLKKNLSDQK